MAFLFMFRRIGPGLHVTGGAGFASRIGAAVCYDPPAETREQQRRKPIHLQEAGSRMRAELRPSNLGEILDRTAQMYRSHFLQYFGIAAVAYSGILLLTLLGDLVTYNPAHKPQAHVHGAYAGISIGVGVAIGLFSILPVAVGMAAVMRTVARNYLGESCTIREAYLSVGRRWYRYILILLAMYFYAALPVGVVGGLLAVSTFLLPGAGRIFAIGLAVLLVFAGLIFVVWRMLRWALSVPASLLEDLTVHRALRRSSILTQGSAWRIFVLLLLVVAVMMLIQYVIQVPLFVLLWKSHGVPTLSMQIVAAFGTFFSGSFVLPIYSIALTLFYYDQRIRKEGYDVEWLMEQAGMATAAATLHVGVSGPISPGPLIPETESPGPPI